MNLEKALKILNITGEVTESKVKKQYYKMALRCHPDKNNSAGGAERFHACNDAYVFLQQHLDVEIEDTNHNYLSLFKKCIRTMFPDIQWDDIFLETTVSGIIKNCRKISLKIFEKISKDKAFELYAFLSTHAEVFSLSDTVLKEMYTVLQKKMKRDNIVILNPTIDDLLNDKVYKLKIEERTFMVPLWHHEVCFDISGADLIVQSLPDLESHIFIDNHNNIICKFEGKIQRVLDTQQIIIKIGNKFFVVQGENLHIKPQQTYVLRNAGILTVAEEDLYSTKERGHIYVEIKLY